MSPPGSELYSDSLPGVRLVIEGIDSMGRLFSTANETRNVTMHSASTQRNAVREIATGTTGLKSAATAKNPAAQRYFPARHACATTIRALTQIRISSISW